MKYYLLYLILSIIIFVFIIPPFQKPDEPNHFYRAVSVATGQFFCHHNAAGDYLDIPKSLHDFPIAMQADLIAFNPNSRFILPLLSDYYPAFLPGEPQVRLNLCSLSFIGYLPAALIISLTQFLHNSLISFYLSRLVLSLTFYVTLLHCYRLIPKGYRYIILFIGALPMTLDQVSSINYAGAQITLSLLIFSYFLKFIDEQKLLSLKQITLFSSFIILLNLIRPGYYLYSLMWWAVPKRLISQNTKKYLALTAAFFIVLMLLTLKLTAYSQSVLDYTPVNPLVSIPIQTYIVVHYPQIFMAAFLNTLSQFRYLAQSIGVLGWANLSFNTYFYILVTLVGGLIIYTSRNSKSKKGWLSLSQVLLILVIVLGTFIGLSLIMYLIWTPIGFDEVEGLQGRYFIPLIPFIMLLIMNIRIKAMPKVIHLFIGYGVVLILCLLYLKTINNRFYDLSSVHLTNPLTATGLNQMRRLANVSETTPNSWQVIIPSDERFNQINGFFLHQENIDHPIYILYHYDLKTADCLTTLRSGFLNALALSQNTDYNQSFKPLKNLAASYCLEIKPVTPVDGQNQLNIATPSSQLNLNLAYPPVFTQ